MQIIDAHIHFWDLKNKINSWVLRSSNPNLQKDYLPDNLVNVSTNELIGVVHVEAHDSAIPTITEVTWLKAVMKNHKLQYKHIAYADITLPFAEFKKVIDGLASYHDVLGIRHILSYTTKFNYNHNESDLSNHKNIAKNLEYIALNNLIFDCQAYSSQMKNLLPAIIKSNVTTIIDHILLPAWDEQNDEDCKLWQDTIMELAKHTNIYLKLSGLNMFQAMENYDFVVDFCLDNFPQERLMYGSNYPVSCNNNYNDWINCLLSKNIEPRKSSQIFYENAKKLFKFDLSLS